MKNALIEISMLFVLLFWKKEHVKTPNSDWE